MEFNFLGPDGLSRLWTHILGKIPKVVLLSFDNYNAGNPYAMGNKNPSILYVGYANERGMTISTRYTVNDGVMMDFWTSTAGFDITNTSSDLGCAISNATEEKITFGDHTNISSAYLRNLNSYRYIIGG